MNNNNHVPEQIHMIALHYFQATGIPCTILDIVSEQLLDCPCDFCRFASLSTSDSLQDACLHSHLHHARLSEEFGGSYVYFCHDPILFWTSPVLQKGRMDYAIVAGPVLVTDPTDIIEVSMAQDESIMIHLVQVLESIVHVDIDKVHHLAELLRMCAGWASGPSEFRMEETRRTLGQQSSLSDVIQHMKEDVDGNNIVSVCYPLELEEQLQDAIRWGFRMEAQRIMNDLLGRIFFTEGNTFERINFRILDLMALLARAAVQGGAPASEIHEISFRCQREIRLHTSMEGLSRWLSEVLHRYADLVFSSRDNTYGTHISRALLYIRKYHTRHLTLDEVASEVLLSVSYFSRLFHQRVGESFTTYVNRIRIEHACRLLDGSDLSLVEVAGAVGFEDQSYFSKVFRRLHGISPGKYRTVKHSFPSETQELHCPTI